MAELGLLASLIAVAGAAAQISLGLFKIASDIGSAGKEVRLIASDTNAFSVTLTNLGQVLRNSTATVSTERARNIAQDLIVLCKEILEDSATLLKVLEPLVKLSGKKWRRGALRVRWLFEKSKFAFHRQSLEALKATLTLLMATMTYADAATRPEIPDTVSTSLKLQLESIREEVKLNNNDYDRFFRSIQSDMQAMRANALLEYAKIDGDQSTVTTHDDSDSAVDVQQGNEERTPSRDGLRSQSPRTGRNEPVMSGAGDAGEITEQESLDVQPSDQLAVPVTALAICTGLPGLPRLQRQTIHFADDVLDTDPETFASMAQSSELVPALPVSDASTSQQNNTTTNIGSASASSEQASEPQPSPSIGRVLQNYAALREAYGKIAIKDFKIGDLVLFLPTRNQETRPWAAFNIGAPHYFLREQPSHRLRQRDWMVARITKIETRIVDLHRPLSDSAGPAGDPDDNPFQLSDGLRWWFVDAKEENFGAPRTPGSGSSTVAASAIEVKGRITGKKSGGSIPADDATAEFAGSSAGSSGMPSQLTKWLPRALSR